jgi:hypothetical protein
MTSRRRRGSGTWIGTGRVSGTPGRSCGGRAATGTHGGSRVGHGRWLARGRRTLGRGDVPTDAEVRGKKLDELRQALDGVKAKRAQNGEALRLAKLEDDAQAQLTSAQRDALNQANITDRTDVSALQAERDRLVNLVDATQALIDAVKAVA